MNKKSRVGLRLVKCPKCAKILPEPEQVPVYACGGCNTVLKAKYYRSGKNVRGSGLQQENVIQSNGVAYVLSGGESDGSSQRSSSAGRQSLDQNEERDQGLVVNHNNGHIETANGAHHTSLSDESRDDKTDQFVQTDCVVAQNQGQLILDKEQFEVALKNKSASVVKDNGKEGDGYVDCLGEKLEQIKLDEAPLPKEITQGGQEDSTVTLEIGEIDSLSASSSARYMIITGEVISTNVSQLPHCEFPRQKIENFDNSSWHGSENLKSTHTVNGPRPLTKGSFASEESMSSFDGNDDQASRSDEHEGVETLPGNNAVSGFVYVEESSVWNNEPFGIKASEGEVISSSLLPDEKLNRSTLEDEESIEESQLPSRRTVTNRHRLPPKIPPSYWSSEVAYETGSSSSTYVHDELPCHHMCHPPYRYKNPETCVRKTHTNRGHVGRRRRFSEEGWRENEFLAMYYGYETSGEICQRAGYHDSCINQRRRSESWSPRGILPRMPYSGEVFNERYQIHNPYMVQHRYLDDLRWSAQLPPTGVYCRGGLCVPPSREMSWDPYESYLTNPRRLMETRPDPEPYSWAHDMIILSDDQGYKDEIMRRLYLREKRHLQPVAGGAPFITCCFCFRVLRLPEDFLSSKRKRKRTHMLKCGACSKILELSFDNECCFPARMPNSCKEAQTDRASKGNFISDEAKVQNADGRALLSDDSFRGSERENSKPAPRNEERKEESDNEASGSSVQERQMKVTWQLPARTKSPLHRLMGYSSLDDLLNGHAEDREIV